MRWWGCGAPHVRQTSYSRIQLPVKSLLSATLAAALLLAVATPAGACTAGSAACRDTTKERPATEHRRAPRIIFGQTEASDFQFRPFRPLRRSDASTRQAYFGSGKAYSGTLARLQEQLQAITARSRLEGLDLTPAQEAAMGDMPPALARALALSKREREEGADRRP